MLNTEVYNTVQYVYAPFIKRGPCIVWMSFMVSNVHIKLLLLFFHFNRIHCVSAVNFDIKFVTQYEHGILKHWILRSGAICFIIWWFAFYQLSHSECVCMCLLNKVLLCAKSFGDNNKSFDDLLLSSNERMWPQIDSHIFAHFDSNSTFYLHCIIGPCAVVKTFIYFISYGREASKL